MTKFGYRRHLLFKSMIASAQTLAKISQPCLNYTWSKDKLSNAMPREVEYNGFTIS